MTAEEREDALKNRVWFVVEGATLMSQADGELPPLVLRGVMAEQRTIHVSHIKRRRDPDGGVQRPDMCAFGVSVEMRAGTVDELVAEYRRKLVIALGTMLDLDEVCCTSHADTAASQVAAASLGYVPGETIVESKSLKLYLWSYRNEGVFQEHLINTICDDLITALEPHWIEVTGAFKARGGLTLTVVVNHDKSAQPLHA